MEEEKFRTIPGDPVGLLKYVAQYEPELEDMTDEQVEMLIDVLEGVQLYVKDYGVDGTTNAEKVLKVSFPALFSRYRYRSDPNLDIADLEMEPGEDVYEWLVRYEK